MGAPASGGSGLARGLAVLEALGSEEALQQGGLGVVRVSAVVGAHKSQVSRTLALLADSGFVERLPDRSYRLGWRLYGLAAQAGDQRLLAAASPVLEHLVATVEETAHVSVRHGTEVLTVLSRSPRHAVQAVGWAGRAVPACCTSSGRVLLSGLEAEDIAALFADSPLLHPTSAAPANIDELIRRVNAVARRGVAVVSEELEPGLVGVAAPIRDSGGTIIASLNISGPKFRLWGKRQFAIEALRAAAQELSEALTVTRRQPSGGRHPESTFR